MLRSQIKLQIWWVKLGIKNFINKLSKKSCISCRTCKSIRAQHNSVVAHWLSVPGYRGSIPVVFELRFHVCTFTFELIHDYSKCSFHHSIHLVWLSIWLNNLIVWYKTRWIRNYFLWSYRFVSWNQHFRLPDSSHFWFNSLYNNNNSNNFPKNEFLSAKKV